MNIEEGPRAPRQPDEPQQNSLNAEQHEILDPEDPIEELKDRVSAAEEGIKRTERIAEENLAVSSLLARGLLGINPQAGEQNVEDDSLPHSAIAEVKKKKSVDANDAGRQSTQSIP